MQIKYLKGFLTILTAMATPFGAFALNETSLRAAIVLALVAGIGAAHNWIDTAFSTPDAPPASLPTPPAVATPAPAAELAHAASQDPTPGPLPPIPEGK